MITKVAATPHCLKYFTNASAPIEAKSQAQVIADCAAGPLRDLLSKADTLQKWVRLPHNQADKLSIYLTETADVDASAGCAISTGAAGMRVFFSCTGPAGPDLAQFVFDNESIAFVELRFHHSIDR